MAANVSISHLFNLLAAEVCLQYQGEVSRFHAAHYRCLQCFDFSGSKQRGVSSPLLLHALRVNPPMEFCQLSVVMSSYVSIQTREKRLALATMH